MSMIAISGLHKHYGDYHALRGIDLQIGQGAFFSLLGPSGCGKTTLLRTIAGFEDPSEGHLSIDGRDMAGVSANLRPTNMVFQSYAIFPHLNVARNVAFGLKSERLSEKDKASRVGAALEMVGLSGYEKRSAQALSGGQRQRVALARALVLEPKVLLLDEPLSALDKKLREQMQSELRRLQRQIGITFVLVTHDQEEALILSDQIAVMFEGQIAQIARPQDLYLRPNSKHVATFIGVMNLMPATVTNGVADVAGLGRVAVTADQAPKGLLDGAMLAGLRPESMRIVYDDTAAGAHLVNGQVVESAYYGDMTYYDVAVNGLEKPLTLSMKNIAGRPILDRGQMTKIAWDVQSLVLLPKD
jgi:spermidine/putrescine transport system ATP-binding protein